MTDSCESKYVLWRSNRIHSRHQIFCWLLAVGEVSLVRTTKMLYTCWRCWLMLFKTSGRAGLVRTSKVYKHVYKMSAMLDFIVWMKTFIFIIENSFWNTSMLPWFRKTRLINAASVVSWSLMFDDRFWEKKSFERTAILNKIMFENNEEYTLFIWEHHWVITK